VSKCQLSQRCYWLAVRPVYPVSIAEMPRLNVAVLSSRRAVDAIILRLQCLRDQWNADDPTRVGDVVTYQEAVQVAVAAYHHQMSCNPHL